VRYFIKPLQFYFRDFIKFGFDLKNINYISRNEINLINYNLNKKLIQKKKLTKIIKLILNSRLLFRKIIIISNNTNKDFFMYKKLMNLVLKPIYLKIQKNTLDYYQLKKILK